MIYLFVILSLSVAPVFASEKKFTACKSDRECIKIADVCGGAISINGKFKELKEKQIKEAQAVSLCLAVIPEILAYEKKLKPFCVKRVCTLR